MTTTSTVRVMVVDDHDLTRAGIRAVLREAVGLEIIAELNAGTDLLPAVESLDPDIVVMGVRMPGVDGVRAIRTLRGAGRTPPILVLTAFADDVVLTGALRAGAAGLLLERAPAEDLRRAIRIVAAGGAWLDPDVTGPVLRTFREATPVPQPHPEVGLLTAREREVLALAGAGLSNAEIAGRLYVGQGTVKTHLLHVFSKLDLRDRAAAVVFAFDNGLVRPGSSERHHALLLDD